MIHEGEGFHEYYSMETQFFIYFQKKISELNFGLFSISFASIYFYVASWTYTSF